MNSPKIVTYGFEGVNRCGKGTQTSLIKEGFEAHGIPALVIKGDGRRPAIGDHLGDPQSEWRNIQNPRLINNGEDNHMLREEAAHRLAREYLIFKNRILPALVDKHKAELGILLVDRSLISRTMIPMEYGLKNLFYGNYEGGQEINVNDIMPDLLFCFDVSKEKLIERLDSTDPKFELRKGLIERKSGMHVANIALLPEPLQQRVVIVNGNNDILQVNRQLNNSIYNHLKTTHGINLNYLINNL